MPCTSQVGPSVLVYLKVGSWVQTEMVTLRRVPAELHVPLSQASWSLTPSPDTMSTLRADVIAPGPGTAPGTRGTPESMLSVKPRMGFPPMVHLQG